jgi:hypothetical protein
VPQRAALDRPVRLLPVAALPRLGRRSRQIDIAIYHNLYSPLVFPHESGLHIAAQSVYAIFDKRLTTQLIWLAGPQRLGAILEIANN